MPNFPSTPVLDDFNRADEGPPPSASWTTWGNAGLKVVSNQCAPDDTGSNRAYWSAAVAGQDQEAYVTLAALGDDTTFSGIAARIDPAGGGSTGDYYLLSHTVTTGTDTMKLERVDSSVGTTIWGPTDQELAAGDAIGIRCEGSTIEAWAKISGTWTLLASVTDTTYSGVPPNNKIGLYNDNGATTDARYDDFGGGVEDYIKLTASSPGSLTIPANASAAALTLPANSSGALTIPANTGGTLTLTPSTSGTLTLGA